MNLQRKSGVFFLLVTILMTAFSVQSNATLKGSARYSKPFAECIHYCSCTWVEELDEGLTPSDPDRQNLYDAGERPVPASGSCSDVPTESKRSGNPGGWFVLYCEDRFRCTESD